MLNMQTSLRPSYQYYDYAGPLIDLNNTRPQLVLHLDSSSVPELELGLESQPHHQLHHQYHTGEQQPLFQQSQFQQLPLTESHLNDIHQQHNEQPHQVTVVSSEPQNFDCFLDTATSIPTTTTTTTTATCYSTGHIVQPQATELNSTPHLLSNPPYNEDASHQQCQLLNSHAVLSIDNPNHGPHDATKQKSLPTNLYHQQLHNETTNQQAYHQHTHSTFYYDPSQLEGSNCSQLEQPILAPSYHLNQLVVAEPLQQVSTVAPACDYFHFQPQQPINDQHQLQLLHPKESDKLNEQNFQQASGKFATFASSHPVDELSTHHQELFQPATGAHSFDTTRFLDSSQPLDHQQRQHQFQEQALAADIQHYHELIKRPNVASSFTYLDSGSVERRQTFEPSLASQEETQSSSSASVSSSEESAGSILTRDEKKAREANIPIAYNDIINLSIEQFNEQLSKYNLSESQLNLIKDIRRRGKNKVAAQSCRKRKMEQICELQHEVGHLSCKRKLLSAECEQLVETHDRIVHQYKMVYSMIQEHLAAGQ